jgi:hypothetical protein
MATKKKRKKRVVINAGTGRAPGKKVRGSRLHPKTPRRKGGVRPKKPGRTNKKSPSRAIDLFNAVRPIGTPMAPETDLRAIEIDVVPLMADAWAGGTDEQIALWHGITLSMLRDRFSEFLKRARAGGDLDVLRAQMTLATGIITKYFRGKHSRVDAGTSKYMGQVRLKQTNALGDPADNSKLIIEVVHRDE